MLRAPDDGTYTVPWEIRAENLAEPARGELKLEITTQVEPVSPVITLDELVRLIEEEDGEEGDE
jgi:hypothetical protein